MFALRDNTHLLCVPRRRGSLGLFSCLTCSASHAARPHISLPHISLSLSVPPSHQPRVVQLSGQHFMPCTRGCMGLPSYHLCVFSLFSLTCFIISVSLSSIPTFVVFSSLSHHLSLPKYKALGEGIHEAARSLLSLSPSWFLSL